MSTSRRLQAAGVALASVLLLGGCAAGTHPGAAAVVGSTEITVGDLDDTTRSVSTALGQPFTTGAALTNLVNTALIKQITEKRSISITEAEITPAMKAVVDNDEAVYGRFVQDPVANTFLRDVAIAAVGTLKLGGGTGLTDPNGQQAQQAGLVVIKDAAKDINVDISPRFGTWTDGSLVATASGSLSEESPQTKAEREKQEQSQQQPQQQPQG